jgi:hypothetical protein
MWRHPNETINPPNLAPQVPYAMNSFIYFDDNQQLFGINGYSHHHYIPTATAMPQ